MTRRLLPALLALAAVTADGHGSHGIARDLLLGAVPFASVSAIVAFGAALERRDDVIVAFRALCWVAIVALLVISCAMRSSALSGVPPLAVSSLFAALGVFVVMAVVTMAPHARRLSDFRPAKP